MDTALNKKDVSLPLIHSFMLHVQTFTCNPFAENGYLLYDDTNTCVVIDPGCYTHIEKQTLVDFISKKGLKLDKILCTHGHIDHILGNDFLKQKYQVEIFAHKIAENEMKMALQYGAMYGILLQSTPMPSTYIDEGDTVSFGDTTLEVIFTPGHSAGHVSFLHRESKQLFSGDVLFDGSVGRWDLPGGNFDILMETIRTKLLTLDDETKVYPGHGSTTLIGRERHANPYLREL